MDIEDLIMTAKVCMFKDCSNCPSKERVCCRERTMLDLANAVSTLRARIEALEGTFEESNKARFFPQK